MLQVKVIKRAPEADGIVSFELAAANGDDLPAFTAGAHIDVHAGEGLTRQYSLCGASSDRRRWLIGVLNEPQSRGGSRRMHESVRDGDLLMVSEPKNHFPLVAGARHSLLFAGGIGITPILSMADELSRGAQEYSLHYCGRSRARMAFLGRIAESPVHAHCEVYCDDALAEHRFDAAKAVGGPSPGKHLYVCGPAGFMDHVLAAARAKGWPEDHLHREYFAAAPVDKSNDGSFEIELKSSGRVVVVPPNRTAARALADAGVDIPLSCEQGVCGTCIVPVLSGIPDHRDMYFTEEERARNDCFTPCCSRAQTQRLVLDL